MATSTQNSEGGPTTQGLKQSTYATFPNVGVDLREVFQLM